MEIYLSDKGLESDWLVGPVMEVNITTCLVLSFEFRALGTTMNHRFFPLKFTLKYLYNSELQEQAIEEMTLYVQEMSTTSSTAYVLPLPLGSSQVAFMFKWLEHSGDVRIKVTDATFGKDNSTCMSKGILFFLKL